MLRETRWVFSITVFCASLVIVYSCGNVTNERYVYLSKSNVEEFKQQILSASEIGGAVSLYAQKFDSIKNPAIKLEVVYTSFLDNFVYESDEGSDVVMKGNYMFSQTSFKGDCDDFALGLFTLHKALGYEGRICFVDYGQGQGHAFFQSFMCGIDELEFFGSLSSIRDNPFFKYKEITPNGVYLTLEGGVPPKKVGKKRIIKQVIIYTDGTLETHGY